MIQQAPFEAYRDAIIFGATDEYQIAKQAESIGLPGFDREDASFDGGQGLPGNLMNQAHAPAMWTSCPLI
jgi:hypothetical protein